MRSWVPTVRLTMVEQGTGEEIEIGRSVFPELVRAASDQLLAEANEHAQAAEGDAVLVTLLELEAERLEQAVRRLIAEPAHELRVVPPEVTR
jgi:hypothetical protein